MQNHESLPTVGLLSQKRVLELTGLATTTLWRYEKSGRFPRKLKLGPRRVAWRAKDIVDWLEDPEAWRAQNGEFLL